MIQALLLLHSAVSEISANHAPMKLESFQSEQTIWETSSLKKLEAQGLELSPMRVVPASAEDAFYRLNSLPEQLSKLFASIDTSFPDEDDIEELAPQAEQLLKRHYLLDEFIDQFYSALEDLPSSLRVRRCEEEGQRAIKGRPTLIALKEVWTHEWSFDALMNRLERTKSIALNAAPTIIGVADETPASSEVQDKVQDILGEKVSVWIHNKLAITRLVR